MTFKGSDIFNDNSKIIAGGKLTFKDGAEIRNNESSGTKAVKVIGTWSGDNIEYDPYRVRYGWSGSDIYNQVVSTETIKLSNDLVQENLGGYITGSAPTANFTTTVSSTFAGGGASTETANSQATRGLTGWVNIRNTASDSITVPNSSLFTVNPNASGSYVQTDPRFTSYGQWLSSDYMLSALNLDPADMHKRLGDGYYEQKLIRDQVAQLTGRRFLTGYNNDDDQYKALMNAGVTFAGEYNLRPGIALTPEQLARLTSDIVWLVEETVTLPNGSKVQALVPKVYVAVKPGDVTGEGALISADSMDLKLNGNLDNSGTLLGRQLIKIDANNITNSGLIQSNLIDAKAQLDFNNIGGTVNAHTGMNIEAGRDVNIVSTTSTAQSHAGLSGSTLTQVDRVAGLYVGNGSDSTTSDQAMTSLSVKAGRDVNLTAASIQNDSKNQTLINADGNINLNTVQTQSGVDLVASDVNNSKYLATNQVGTQINTTGNVQLKAKDSITATAANINSDTGKVILTADKDVNLLAAQDQLNYESNSYHKETGFLSSSMSQTHQKSETSTASGSNVTGQQVLIQAGHDAKIVGSNVVSDNLTQINAGNDVNILAAQNSQTAEGFSVSKQSGLLGTGGIGFMIGSKKQSTDIDNTNVTQTGSQVGSLGGKVNIVAGNQYQQTGSSVTSGQSVDGQFVAGDAVNIVAKSIDITAGQNTYATDTVHQTKQSGLTVAVNVPVLNAVMAVADTAKTVGQSKNDRVNAMAAANTAYSAYKGAEAVGKLAKSGMDSVKDLNASVSITVGSSQSKQETHTQGTEAVSSTVAGKEVNLIATGAGTNSNIHVQGSNISGTDTTRLIADNNVILESAQNTSDEHSANKSSGWNAGVVVGTQGIGFTVGGNYGKGKGEGTSVTQVNSHVGSQTGQTLIQAGDTTRLAGAQVLGNRVELDTKNLEIESRQDTNQYNSKQKDMSAQLTVGMGGSISGSYSQNKVNADYASVNEQSGILAGDGGYNVNVKNHTDLKGGIITSTQAAEDAGRNRFSTGTLSASDIQNHADYSASGFGLSGGVSVGTKDSGGTKEDPKTGTQTNLGIGKDNRSVEVTKSIGYGSDSGHDRSTTTSGINTSNISITDVAGQNAAGTRVEQIKAQVKTDTTTDTVQANSGALANNFDKDSVQKEIGLQVAVTQQFDITRQGVKAEINKQVDKQQQAVKEAETALKLNPNDQAAVQKLADAHAAIENWQQGGVLVDMIAGGLSGPTSTGAAGTIANAAAPALQYAVGQYFKDQKAEGSTAHIVAHTVLAAAVAAAGGNDVLTAGLSAGGAELLAPKVANWLFGNTAGIEKDKNGNVIASKLTAEQKQTISNIVSLGAAGLTAGAGGTGTDVVSSSQLASSAVEDNRMLHAGEVMIINFMARQFALKLNDGKEPTNAQIEEARKRLLAQGQRDVSLLFNDQRFDLEAENFLRNEITAEVLRQNNGIDPISQDGRMNGLFSANPFSDYLDDSVYAGSYQSVTHDLELGAVTYNVSRNGDSIVIKGNKGGYGGSVSDPAKEILEVFSNPNAYGSVSTDKYINQYLDANNMNTAANRVGLATGLAIAGAYGIAMTPVALETLKVCVLTSSCNTALTGLVVEAGYIAGAVPNPSVSPVSAVIKEAQAANLIGHMPAPSLIKAVFGKNISTATLKTADELNAPFLAAGGSAPYPAATIAVKGEIPAGTQMQMIIDDEALKKFKAGETWFGGFATFNNVGKMTEQEARNATALAYEFKGVSKPLYVITVETTKPMPANVGLIGSQPNTMTGGAFTGVGGVQVQILTDTAAQRGNYLKALNIENAVPLK